MAVTCNVCGETGRKMKIKRTCDRCYRLREAGHDDDQIRVIITAPGYEFRPKPRKNPAEEPPPRICARCGVNHVKSRRGIHCDPCISLNRSEGAGKAQQTAARRKQEREEAGRSSVNPAAKKDRMDPGRVLTPAEIAALVEAGKVTHISRVPEYRWHDTHSSIGRY